MNTIIEDVKKIDDELYKAVYIENNYEKRQEIWNSIKRNPKILEQAIKVVKDKFCERDTFFSNAIVECMLMDYNNYDEDPNQLSLFEDYCATNHLYQDLVNKIYSNVDLARIVLDGYSNGGYSFLLYTLFNDNLDLTDEQKKFALDEAMNKIGTTKYSKQMEDYEQELEKRNITDDLTVIAPEIGPVGAKTFNSYIAGIFASMNTNQAHGTGEYDIRYYILKNHNFADKMKQLVYDFYVDDELFDETVNYWEWNIINICVREEEKEPMIYIDELLFITDEEIYNKFPNEQAKKIIENINFIKKIHELRPAKWEKENTNFQKVLV